MRSHCQSRRWSLILLLQTTRWVFQIFFFQLALYSTKQLAVGNGNLRWSACWVARGRDMVTINWRKRLQTMNIKSLEMHYIFHFHWINTELMIVLSHFPVSVHVLLTRMQDLYEAHLDNTWQLQNHAWQWASAEGSSTPIEPFWMCPRTCLFLSCYKSCHASEPIKQIK